MVQFKPKAPQSSASRSNLTQSFFQAGVILQTACDKICRMLFRAILDAAALVPRS